MTIDPRIVATILNVVALLGVLGLIAWLGLRILRGRSRWPKPILALIFTFAAMALVTFPFSFGASTESQVQQTIEVDR
jgi:cytochrome c oxidase assembly factor CtaG